jgi:hypothetical protein
MHLPVAVFIVIVSIYYQLANGVTFLVADSLTVNDRNTKKSTVENTGGRGIPLYY